MDYKTYQPNPGLSNYVRCYWTLEAPKEKAPEKQRIVPDGCMEMIFHYGDLYRQYLDGSTVLQPRCFVFGQVTQPLEIVPTGETGVFAVRFLPEGFAAFATFPVGDMENRAVPLQELFAEEGIDLEKEILNALNTEERIQLVERFLLHKLITPESVHQIVRSGVAAMMKLKGQVSVDELTDNLKINRRQLERKFSIAVGLSPKQLSKMIRLQSVLKIMADPQFTSLTSIAYQGDYYDQAHLIKDFKEFAGMSPKKFYSNNLKMSSLFSGTD
ncbi:Helix-turn-helix domain-containing protein [Pedobacter steynii]|uniref:Helix-turn-helix domain-containing protein n=1 Tax=Pedobacter steynii TaxID=430522 RepID=A0A1G9L0Z1_9SPHI|nr:helix-turn-helix transcriptional regulator [Pedobacter steynii]NQX38696.1 helix-turn-helix transcriptional regulator [Pedobacter steynii]SDL55609.1 Helix-turn-helix domain-containing protein [Pedobacter steynii]